MNLTIRIWEPYTLYETGDVAVYRGKLYIATDSGVGILPHPSSAFWSVVPGQVDNTGKWGFIDEDETQISGVSHSWIIIDEEVMTEPELPAGFTDLFEFEENA